MAAPGDHLLWFDLYGVQIFLYACFRMIYFVFNWFFLNDFIFTWKANFEIHSPKGCNNLIWAKAKARARGFLQVSHMGADTQGREPSSVVSQARSREQGPKWSTGDTNWHTFGMLVLRLWISMLLHHGRSLTSLV